MALKIQKQNEKNAAKLLASDSHESSLKEVTSADLSEIIDSTPTRDELMTDVKNMVQTVEWTMIHVEDDIQLPQMQIPDLIDVPDELVLKNQKLITQLEETIIAWEGHISKVIEECLKKVLLSCYYYIVTESRVQ